MAPSLTTAIGRIQFALGDHGTTSLLEGGASQYADLLTLCGGDEATTFRAAAGALAAYYASKVDRLGSGGDTLQWSNRVKKWTDQASGKDAYPFAADGDGAGATSFSVAGQRSDGYSAAADGSEYGST